MLSRRRCTVLLRVGRDHRLWDFRQRREIGVLDDDSSIWCSTRGFDPTDA